MLHGLMELYDEFLIPQVPTTDGNWLYDVFFQLRLDHPEIFWAVGFKYRYYKDSPNLILIPEYIFDKNKIREHQKALGARVDKLLEGYVDIYLPDLKYLDPELAQKFSYAPDYVQAAKAAIGEMVRQTGKCEFGEDGYIRKGTIVRHLILPGHTGNSIKALRYLHETYGEDIYISIMNQYTPVRKFVEFKELNRKVTKREYEKVLDAAVDMGIQNGFIQEGEAAKESFIPEFNLEGIGI